MSEVKRLALEMITAAVLSGSWRKMTLFNCARCRTAWPFLTDARSCFAVEQAERYVDGGCTQTELAAAQEDAARVPLDLSTAPFLRGPARTGPERLRREAWTWAAEQASRTTIGWLPIQCPGSDVALHIALARDIFGTPPRAVAFSPAWRTDTAVALSRQMYESRDFSAMPILADALQDAGCDSAAVLDHCRGPGPHVRGCWVVDLVLGKE